ncbi:MAG: RNA 2',3'-cyclic phosphodiesterase [Myxococcales bacterium]|nr:RNA 2',3'-cyclic phosphodiesterase [Myxococcales bacterium]MCB9713291.1 RNA 2',3'-cyclic phosphodiesterase [Myxococcales bacterium]
MRLFVGIDLPAVVDDHLALVAGGIPGARWLEAEQLHVTLRFIGEVDGGTKRQLEDALGSVSHPPFELGVVGVGTFPPRGKARTLWAGLEPSEPLRALAAKVEHAVVSAGLPPEPRKFAPHVTLARLRDSPQAKVIAFLQHHALLRTTTFEVDELLLYSSVLSPRGAKYRVEHGFKLRG